MTFYMLRVTFDHGVSWEYIPGQYSALGFGTKDAAKVAARRDCNMYRSCGYNVEVCAHDMVTN